MQLGERDTALAGDRRILADLLDHVEIARPDPRSRGVAARHSVHRQNTQQLVDSAGRAAAARHRARGPQPHSLGGAEQLNDGGVGGAGGGRPGVDRTGRNHAVGLAPDPNARQRTARAHVRHHPRFGRRQLRVADGAPQQLAHVVVARGGPQRAQHRLCQLLLIPGGAVDIDDRFGAEAEGNDQARAVGGLRRGRAERVGGEPLSRSRWVGRRVQARARDRAVVGRRSGGDQLEPVGVGVGGQQRAERGGSVGGGLGRAGAENDQPVELRGPGGKRQLDPHPGLAGEAEVDEPLHVGVDQQPVDDRGRRSRCGSRDELGRHRLAPSGTRPQRSLISDRQEALRQESRDRPAGPSGFACRRARELRRRRELRRVAHRAARLILRVQRPQLAGDPRAPSRAEPRRELAPGLGLGVGAATGAPAHHPEVLAPAHLLASQFRLMRVGVDLVREDPDPQLGSGGAADPAGLEPDRQQRDRDCRGERLDLRAGGLGRVGLGGELRDQGCDLGGSRRELSLETADLGVESAHRRRVAAALGDAQLVLELDAAGPARRPASPAAARAGLAARRRRRQFGGADRRHCGFTAGRRRWRSGTDRGARSRPSSRRRAPR